jgi:serine/threonine-protein kinase BUR1
LPPQEDSLLKEHTAISFVVPSKKPQAPKPLHSPPSFIPPEAENKDAVALDSIKEVDTVVPTHRIQKHVVKRSRKEEEEAYGRTFQGCGSITDYDITTKLGEGTFGLVSHLFEASSSMLTITRQRGA